jgi:hypothetical protein
MLVSGETIKRNVAVLAAGLAMVGVPTAIGGMVGAYNRSTKQQEIKARERCAPELGQFATIGIMPKYCRHLLAPETPYMYFDDHPVDLPGRGAVENGMEVLRAESAHDVENGLNIGLRLGLDLFAVSMWAFFAKSLYDEKSGRRR